jgi:hypothetical protein
MQGSAIRLSRDKGLCSSLEKGQRASANGDSLALRLEKKGTNSGDEGSGLCIIISQKESED